MRVGKLKNGKAAVKDEITGEMVDWIWRLFNVTFESGVVPEDWRYAVFVPPYKGKGEKTEGRIIGLLAWLKK